MKIVGGIYVREHKFRQITYILVFQTKFYGVLSGSVRNYLELLQSSEELSDRLKIEGRCVLDKQKNNFMKSIHVLTQLIVSCCRYLNLPK